MTTDNSYLSSEAPESASRKIEVSSGDCILVCTNGIHDLVLSHEWQPVSADVDLQEWLITLKDQVYDSDGNACDNGTAILLRFD